MDKALQVVKSELTTVHAGHTSPSIFNGIVADYCGVPAPFQQPTSLMIPEARAILASLFDHSVMKNIAAAIREPDPGVNPIDDGTVIRAALPALTKEHHKDYIKLTRPRAEDFHVQVRGIRGKTKKELETIRKDNKTGEGGVRRAEHELGSLTKRFVKQIGIALSTKEAGLFKV